MWKKSLVRIDKSNIIKANLYMGCGRNYKAQPNIKGRQNPSIFRALSFCILFILSLFFLSVFSLPNKALAAFNEQINYQGKLFSSTSMAVADGDYNFTFRLYTSASGGSPIWTEECTTTNTVNVRSGLFSHMLGSVNPLSDAIFNQDLYLSVDVGGTTTIPSWDGEMSPRKHLGSVASAFEAKRLSGKTETQFATLAEGETITGSWTHQNSLIISSSTAATLFTITQGGAGTAAEIMGKVAIATSTANAQLTVQGTSTTALVSILTSAGNSALFASSSGFIGINTSTPSYNLDVAGDINISGALRIAGSDLSQYFIDSAGTSGQLWSSDSAGRGAWLSTSSLGLSMDYISGSSSLAYLSGNNIFTGYNIFASTTFNGTSTFGDVIISNLTSTNAHFTNIVGFFGANCGMDNYAYGINPDGTLNCRPDVSGGGGVGGGWATTSDNKRLYPANVAHIVVIGGNVTSSQDTIFETIGNAYIKGNLRAESVTTSDLEATNTTLLNILNVTGPTQLASTTINGTTTMANATATNLGITSNLNVAGQSALGNVSSTNVTISGALTWSTNNGLLEAVSGVVRATSTANFLTTGNASALYVPYTYASSVFSTYAYNTSTFVTYSYGSSTYATTNHTHAQLHDPVTENILGIDLTGQTLSLTSGYFIPTTSPAFASVTTTNLYPTNIIGATNISTTNLTASGNTVLANATGTNLNLTGALFIGGNNLSQYFISSAGTAGQLWASDGSGAGGWVNTSTLGLSYTDLRDNSNLALLNANNTFTGTNTFASTTINGTTTMANATATNLGITSNLNVAGQTNFVTASGTAATLSGNQWVGGALYVTGQTSLGNVSSTNLTVSNNSYLGTIKSGTWNGSVIDISSYTNLSAGSGIVLTGDTLSHDTANGYIHIPANGASTQLLQYSSAGTAKWITMSGDASIADNGAIAVADDSHAHTGATISGSLVLTGASSTYATATWALLGNASTTNLTVSNNSYLGTIKSGTWNGSIIGAAYLGSGSPSANTLLFGDGAWKATSTLGLSYTDLRDNSNLALLNANNTFTGTNTFASTTINGTTTMANATATNLGITSNLNVAGQTNLGNASGTNLTISNNLFLSTLSGGSIATSANLATSVLALDTALNNLFTNTKEPTGFPNRTDTAMSFNNTTRDFTITGANFKVYSKGREYVKNTESINIPNLKNLYYVYYHPTTQVLTTSTVDWNMTDGTIQIATVFWSPTAAEGLLGEERHGLIMDGMTHEYLHQTVGTRYNSGLTGVFTDPANISITAGSIYDEDILLSTTTNQTQCRVLYRDAPSAFIFTARQNSYIQTNGGNIAYDNGGVLTPVTNGQYVAYWIFATNDLSTPIYSLVGQRQDTSLTNARNNAKYESLTLTGLPFREMKLLYRVILHRTGNGSYAYDEAQDLRSISNLPSGTYLATAHNVLTGLDFASAGHTGFAGLDVENTFTGTNTFASTTINGTTTMANATATNLGITSNLNVAGQTNLGNASTTALTNSGNSYLQNISFTTASGTALTLSSNQWIGGALYVTGQTSLGNASTTNLTISGNSYLGTIISGSGTITNISSTGITATNLYPTNIIGATNISTTNLTASGNTVLANATGTNLNLTGALFIGGNNLSQYFISSAGTAGQLWASDGSGAGGWVNTSTLGLSYTDLRDNSNLALLNANNTFTGTNTFASTTINGTTTMANATATNFGITGNLNVAGFSSLATTTATMINIGTTTYPSNSSLAVQGVGNNPILDIYVSSSTSTLRISTNGNIGFGDTNPFTQFVVGGGRARIVTSSSFLTSNVLENGQKYGSYYYATFNNTGGALLHVVNVSDPENPTTTKVLTTSMKDIPSGMDIKGKYLYIGSFNIGATSSLNVFDISDPNSPTFIASTTFRYVKSVSDLKVAGNYVYAVGGVAGLAGDYDLGVEVFDVSNASAPASVGGAIKSGTYWGYSFDIEDTLLAVSNSDNTNNDTIEFFDISNPATPQWLSSLSLGSIGNTRDIEMVNKFVYIANTAASNGFKIIDARNRSNPNIVYSGLTDTSYRGVSVRGRYAYVFSGSVSSGEMKTLDISSSTNPVLVNRLFGLKNTMPSTVDFDGRYAYVSDGSDQKLRIIDLGGGYIQEAEFGDARASSLVIGKNTSIGGTLNVTGGLNVGQSLQVQDRISGKSLLIFATSTLQNVLPDMAGGTGNVSLYNLGASTTRWNSIWVSSTYIGSGTWQISQGADNQLSIFSSPGSNERLTILSNGFVGIGSTTPAYNFSVSGTIGVTGAYYDTYSTSGAFGMLLQTTGTSTRWVATSTLGLGGGSGTPAGINGSIQYKSDTNFAGNSFLFWDATNKRLGIGTSTPTSSLEVYTSTTNSVLTITADNDSPGSYSPIINFNTNSPPMTFFRLMFDNVDGLGKILAPVSGIESITVNSVFGTVGIGGDADATNNNILSIYGNTSSSGAISAAALNSASTITAVGDIQITGGGRFIGACNLQGTPPNQACVDFAEIYESNVEMEVGEVAVLDAASGKVAKSNEAYQQNIIGVVSTHPGVVLGYNNGVSMAGGYAHDPNNPAIALMGRVPVKVSNENGAIKKGDYLTSASLPGYAMKTTKAGKVIGMALEDFDVPQNNASTSRIMVFMGVSWMGNDLSVQIDANGQMINNPVVSSLRNQLTDIGLVVGEDGTLEVKALKAQKVITNEFETVDKATGQTYCLWIENGDWKKTVGACQGAAAAVMPSGGGDVIVPPPFEQNVASTSPTSSTNVDIPAIDAPATTTDSVAPIVDLATSSPPIETLPVDIPPVAEVSPTPLNVAPEVPPPDPVIVTPPTDSTVEAPIQ